MPQKAINVVEDFDYDSRSETYNRSFREWRTAAQTKYVYSYSDDPREASYVAGKAVTKPSAAHIEQKALSHVCEVIGAALLVYFICEVAGESLITGLFRMLGLEVTLDFLTSSMTDSQLAVAGVRTMTLLLKFGIPICMLIAFFRLPRRVVMPGNFTALPETVLGVGFAMIGSAVYALTANAQGVEDAQTIFTYKDSAVIAGYVLVDAIIGSILAEMMLRGLMIPALRQFGDLFAVGLTAGAAFLFPNALPARIGELLIGLAAGYLVLRGGSVWKCILLRFLYTLLNHARVILLYATHMLPRWQYVMILLLTGLGLVFFYMRVRRNGLLLSNRKTQLPYRRKIFAAAQTLTMLPWLAVSMLMLLVQLFF